MGGNTSSISRSDASNDIKNALGSSNSSRNSTGNNNSNNTNSPQLGGNSSATVDNDTLAFVIKKIMDNPFYEPLHSNEEAKMKFEHCLSDPKRLQETYLNPNWTITMEMVCV